MSENQKTYIVSKDLIDKIVDFLENPFDNTKESIEILKSKDSFTEDEINKIVALLGKFPAYSVYPIIDLFKGNLKVEEIDQQQE
jgi:hypothetical protein